jgi:hexosaminidase
MIQIILYSLCFYVVASSPLWPLPVDSSLGSQSISLSNDFSFVQSAGKSALLDRAITRYVNLIKPSSIENQLNINFCNVHVNQLFENEEQTLLPGVDESYQLIVTTNGECTISSETIWGAMHAMESFTQLLERESNSVVLKYAPVSISDNCRFTHRGLMVDSSRHYLPVNALERIIDTLPMNKFNVLHWHMVDAQSFPVDTPSAPQMIQGAYDSSLVYSMDDIKSLTQYAYDRGVRLLLEVDIPGHAASWTNGYPQIMADCFAKYYYNINDFALNPVLEETYEVVEKVLSDIISVSGAKYFHIGGDEVVYGCWKEDKSITEYMSANNIASYDDLLGYFVLRVDEIVRKLGATPVHWEEVFKAGVDVAPDTVFEVWTAQSQMASIAAANYSIISAPSDVWYLE